MCSFSCRRDEHDQGRRRPRAAAMMVGAASAASGLVYMKYSQSAAQVQPQSAHPPVLPSTAAARRAHRPPGRAFKLVAPARVTVGVLSKRTLFWWIARSMPAKGGKLKLGGDELAIAATATATATAGPAAREGRCATPYIAPPNFVCRALLHFPAASFPFLRPPG